MAKETRVSARIEKECEAKAIGFQRWYLGHVPVHHECISDELVMCISSDNGVPEKEARVGFGYHGFHRLSHERMFAEWGWRGVGM
ncbi:hypothetical protein AMTR_s00071p00073710 [Amborella trichopoda]|uniref:Uncharacterized protein n=1 Tax=Amborella trichopoda TaxID=13333 RepID=U5D2P4_AMBTC|nr:hypothetical protein AMTR_s00071p00073710 [Amborella trichopoda]